MTAEDLILQILKAAGEPLNTSDVLKRCLEVDPNINLSTADRTLRKLAERHRIRRRGDGMYSFQVDTSNIHKLEDYF